MRVSHGQCVRLENPEDVKRVSNSITKSVYEKNDPPYYSNSNSDNMNNSE